MRYISRKVAWLARSPCAAGGAADPPVVSAGGGSPGVFLVVGCPTQSNTGLLDSATGAQKRSSAVGAGGLRTQMARHATKMTTTMTAPSTPIMTGSDNETRGGRDAGAALGGARTAFTGASAGSGI